MNYLYLTIVRRYQISVLLEQGFRYKCTDCHRPSDDRQSSHA